MICGYAVQTFSVGLSKDYPPGKEEACFNPCMVGLPSDAGISNTPLFCASSGVLARDIRRCAKCPVILVSFANDSKQRFGGWVGKLTVDCVAYPAC